mgnify:CR=1 FL=1
MLFRSPKTTLLADTYDAELIELAETDVAVTDDSVTVLPNDTLPVIVPFPLSDKGIYSSYTIVQVDPTGIVIVIPSAIVTGPAVIAFLLVVIV